MYINFTLFTPKLPPFGVGGGGGHEINNHLSPYPTDATYQFLQKLTYSSNNIIITSYLGIVWSRSNWSQNFMYNAITRDLPLVCMQLIKKCS